MNKQVFEVQASWSREICYCETLKEVAETIEQEVVNSEPEGFDFGGVFMIRHITISDEAWEEAQQGEFGGFEP